MGLADFLNKGFPQSQKEAKKEEKKTGKKVVETKTEGLVRLEGDEERKQW